MQDLMDYGKPNHQPIVNILLLQKRQRVITRGQICLKKRLYKQLTSKYGEKFQSDAAQYAIDHLNADYKSNALAKAKSYRKLLKNSKSAIYNQLVSPYGEEFTEEANYAIQHLDD